MAAVMPATQVFEQHLATWIALSKVTGREIEKGQRSPHTMTSICQNMSKYVIRIPTRYSTSSLGSFSNVAVTQGHSIPLHIRIMHVDFSLSSVRYPAASGLSLSQPSSLSPPVGLHICTNMGTIHANLS